MPMPTTRKIILASASPQRKKLLALAGFKFRVIPSRVEEAHQITTTCAALVKHNALIKAEDVASRLKEGLVIGSDTVVFDGKKRIIGKPKNLAAAKAILKDFFKNPHWVYTGVAIIDIKTGRRLIDYEKTKVFMTPLADEEIRAYHEKTPPMDKAGGFDIEGRGSLFIHRIEGCYTNVIGLPMAKLRLMLKEFGVSVLR